MKIVQINSTSGIGSTGRICTGISQYLSQIFIENYILYCYGVSNHPLSIKCADNRYIKIQAGKSHFFGNYGFNSILSTKRIISELERIKPTIVHLHNIHGHDCNLEILFNYFKKKGIKIVWTFHDCWAFTAYCPHFTMVGCNRWKKHCYDCPQCRKYSWFFDRSFEIYQRKKDIFSNLDLTIVTPSQWLAGMVKQSFLRDYPVKVINNGIDLSVFVPTPSEFRKKYSIPKTRYILLGVAFDWEIQKGLDVFLELANRLSPEEYQIVLVGTNEKIDKQLPPNIISIHQTQNQKALAEIYTAADVLVNPTREENYPTVNMEAIACGTPVLTFCTGGSPEIPDCTSGVVVPCNDVDIMELEIHRICTEKIFSQEACLQRAKAFDMNDCFKNYVKLFKSIL